MKIFLFNGQQLPSKHFWLLFLTGCLIAVNLSLISKYDLSKMLATILLLLWALFSNFKKRYHKLNLESSWVAKILGILIIFITVTQCLWAADAKLLVYLLPFISALGLALIASGVKGLKQYWLELTMFLVLAIPLEPLMLPVNQITNFSTLMAKLSTFILWYLGFNVTRQGETVILPEKAIWVSPECGGMGTILWMLQLAIMLFAMYRLKNNQKMLLPLAGILIVVIINGIRLAILAVLAAHNYAAFEYWHEDKAEVFSTIPMLIFVFFCDYVIRHSNQETITDFIQEEVS